MSKEDKPLSKIIAEKIKMCTETQIIYDEFTGWLIVAPRDVIGPCYIEKPLCFTMVEGSGKYGENQTKLQRLEKYDIFVIPKGSYFYFKSLCTINRCLLHFQWQHLNDDTDDTLPNSTTMISLERSFITK